MIGDGAVLGYALFVGSGSALGFAVQGLDSNSGRPPPFFIFHVVPHRFLRFSVFLYVFFTMSLLFSVSMSVCRPRSPLFSAPLQRFQFFVERLLFRLVGLRCIATLCTCK